MDCEPISPITYPEYHFTIHYTYFTPVPLIFFCLPIDPLTTSCHTIHQVPPECIPLIISIPLHHLTILHKARSKKPGTPYGPSPYGTRYYYTITTTLKQAIYQHQERKYRLQHILTNYLYNPTKPGGTQYT